jgi:hypothetical protein
MSNEKKILRSRLRNHAWDALETPVVATTAACTVALVNAGGTPKVARKALAVRP